MIHLYNVFSDSLAAAGMRDAEGGRVERDVTEGQQGDRNLQHLDCGHGYTNLHT